MKQLNSLILILLISSLIVGCSNQTAKTDDLYNDAEYLYETINENWQNKGYLNKTDQDYTNKFVNNYVENYDKFNEADKEIIMEMDKLIHSYKLYFVSNGVKGEDVNNYEKKINDSLNALSDKFNE